MSPKILNLLVKMQKNEATEALIYQKLAQNSKNKINQRLLLKIAKDEERHSQKLKNLTSQSIKPNKIKVFFYYMIARIFGLSFALKLMEKGEKLAFRVYKNLGTKTKLLKSLSLEEQKHEKILIGLLKDKRLEYASSIILGLNDALVELTGALAGLTLALQNRQLIALAGLITGFAASLSMAASAYFSVKEETGNDKKKNPFAAALITGLTYLFTVIILIIPYFLPFLPNAFTSLIISLVLAVFIIFLYTFYITTAKSLSFWKRFFSMAFISLAIAAISFVAGLGLKMFLGIEI